MAVSGLLPLTSTCGTLADWVRFLALPCAFPASDTYALPSVRVPADELVASDG
jgi:hypothetical protein